MSRKKKSRTATARAAKGSNSNPRRSPVTAAVDNVLRRALKISDPNNADEVAKGLLARNPRDAARIRREQLGLPFSVSNPQRSTIVKSGKSNTSRRKRPTTGDDESWPRGPVKRSLVGGLSPPTLEGISARLDELAGVVIELEKQIKELQAEVGRQKGAPRRIINV